MKKIDVDKIFAEKNPRAHKLLPRFILSYLKKIVHQDELNNFFSRNEHVYDFAFIKEAIIEFGLKEKIVGKENIPLTGGCVIAANHPLGALDFIVMANAVGEERQDMKAVVNDILLNIHNLKNLFAGVNKIGKTQAEALLEIEKVFASNNMVVTFPAGLVSRKQYPNGLFSQPTIKDLEWKKSFVSRAKKHQKNILPVYIDGQNSNFFYNLSMLRKAIGIKANIEMLFLADEMYKQKGKTITVIFGKEISWEVFDKRHSDAEWAEKVKEHVYQIGERKTSVPFAF